MDPQFDVYAPPKAAIQTHPTPVGAQQLYVVAPFKFLLLFMATMGIYQVYWFYKNWQRIKEHTGENIWPVPRGIFAIFFAHSLFGRVQAKIASLGRPFAWSPSATATLYVVLAIASNLFDRLAGRSLGSPWTDFVSIAFVPIVALVLLPAQKAINFASEDPRGDGNSNLTAGNIVWLLLGAVLWLLVGAGILMELGVIPTAE